MSTQGDTLLDEIKTLDPKKIQALLSMLEQKEKALQAQENKLHSQEEKIHSLQHQLDWFKRQLFGQKSEKKDFTDQPYQTTIAELFGAPPTPPPGKIGRAHV